MVPNVIKFQVVPTEAVLLSVNIILTIRRDNEQTELYTATCVH